MRLPKARSAKDSRYSQAHRKEKWQAPEKECRGLGWGPQVGFYTASKGVHGDLGTLAVGIWGLG